MKRGATVRLIARPNEPTILFTPSQRRELWVLNEDAPSWKWVMEIYRQRDPDCRIIVDRTQVEECGLLDLIVRNIDESEGAARA